MHCILLTDSSVFNVCLLLLVVYCLHHGGCFHFVCLFICLFVRLLVSRIVSKLHNQFYTKFDAKVAHWPRKKCLDVGVDLDHVVMGWGRVRVTVDFPHHTHQD